MQIKLFFWRHSGATFLDNLLFVRQESFPLADKHTSHSELVEITGLASLDCLCWPWGRAFDWSCSPRGGDIWIFLRPTWRYLTADSDEKDWDRTYVSHFHTLRIRRTVWKDVKSWRTTRTSESWVYFTVLSPKFVCFSVFLINWTS